MIKGNWVKNNTDEEIEEGNLLIEELMNLPMYEFQNWYAMIEKKQEGSVIYHTYHGTKGLEFDNVLILMENKFGWDRKYFEKFFSSYQIKEELTKEKKMKYEEVRNLIYVSCSRAIRNLRIFYFDDVEVIRSGVEEIFKEIIPLPKAL